MFSAGDQIKTSGALKAFTDAAWVKMIITELNFNTFISDELTFSPGRWQTHGRSVYVTGVLVL